MISRTVGHQDIVKTNFSDDTPTLFLNRGNMVLTMFTRSAGVAKITRWLGWGVQFYDFDNSGWPGILISNGHVLPEVMARVLERVYRQPKLGLL